MTDAPEILFIDAAKYTGWAFGPPGQPPESGSQFFAKTADASHPAIFWGAMRFVADKIKARGPGIKIFIEAPMPTSQVAGQTNAKTTQVLMGVTACIMGMAHGLGCYRVETIRVDKIRKHFIGRNMKGELAKPLVMKKCLALGWVKSDDDDKTFDRSDALAGWSCAEHMLAPRLAQPIDDLFLRASARKSARGL